MWSQSLTGVSALTSGDSSPLFLGTTSPSQFLLAGGLEEGCPITDPTQSHDPSWDNQLLFLRNLHSKLPIKTVLTLVT